MKIFEFSPSVNVLLSFLIWFILPIITTIICKRLPRNYLDSNNPLFREKSFENGGKIYQKIFKIKSWKKMIPDGAIGKNAYKKKYLSDFSTSNLNEFLYESCLAELIHIFAMLPVFLFFLFLDVYLVLVMLIYTILMNVPCIIIQRYNRPRIKRILNRMSS